ncbi:Tetraspanin/Peripherin,Tetraspanin,Tetraspanin, EC2 domain [Cinara cedri]|uniref:Tetraspanin n=1 Tax=Cinara cedri TaxID=506608 RepID=A0A5E4MEM6_9HEMI|nr:Tetraspanin/Peripherin,Tetraspanin,Tetraspanin, EC2 domain [Cinara cedri]
MSIFAFLGKYALYLFNLLCLISSIIILSITFIVWQNFKKWDSFVDGSLISAPKILLFIGIGVFLIAFIGICGVLRDSRCLLILFTILLTIVLIGELVLSAAVYYMGDQVKDYALKEMNDSLPSYNTTNGETSTKIWNLVQSEMECCGVNGPKDWAPVLHNKLPTTCCREIPVDGHCTIIDSYKLGCFKRFETQLEGNEKTIMWSSIGFALVQFLAVLLACFRSRSIREEYETV